MYICEKGYNCCDYQYWDNQENIEEDCDHLVEVKPVKHGYWIEKPNVIGEAYCSECGYALRLHNTNYCPNCGAMMDER